MNLPGSKSAAGKRTENEWNLGEPKYAEEATEKAEEVTKWYGTLVVGPSHSRGVNRVTLVDPKKGTRRRRQYNE